MGIEQMILFFACLSSEGAELVKLSAEKQDEYYISYECKERTQKVPVTQIEFIILLESAYIEHLENREKMEIYILSKKGREHSLRLIRSQKRNSKNQE